MRSGATQIIKEARQLAWPWTLLVLGGLFVLARPFLTSLPELTGTWRGLTEWILPVGAFFGTSLLATLPVGSEFQFRTLAMRFAQPVSREKLWQQKFLMSVLPAAVPAVIYMTAVEFRFGRTFTLVAVSWIVLTLAGAIPFTLLARSTMGGMMLSSLGTSVVTFAWIYYEKHGNFPTPLLAGVASFVVIYTVALIWLGRRMFLRFQAVDGMQAGETFVPGARLVPHFLTQWLVPRSRQPMANLVRRELHVLRALWPLATFNVIAWVLLVAFKQLPGERPESVHVSFVLSIFVGLLVAVLAGTLSLGEEKTWGTHEWHMTLPVSVSLQWGVKLVMALVASVVCVALLPMAIVSVGGLITNSPWPTLTAGNAVLWILEAVVITFVAFWCSCVVRGTVPAVLWMFPVCFALMFAANAPSLIADSTSVFRTVYESGIPGIDPITLQKIVMRFVPIFEHENAVLIGFAPLLAVGLIQSHRFFRAQAPANRLRVFRCALPLLAIAFLCGAISVLGVVLLYGSWRQQWAIVDQTDSAISAVLKTSPDIALPRRLSPEELMKAGPMSDGTKRWLRNASIVVAPAPPRVGTGSGRHYAGRTMSIIPKSLLKDRVPYSAVVRAASGTQCSLIFQIQPEGPVGYLTANCQ